ncbi:hypothetical protein BJ166DRAFT_358219 [Pestalotiopsis sp. NC0098]|nr:hypothetical protein BJ166DRAFT_358219 [Pestalotiopsis sp. NC0098]
MFGGLVTQDPNLNKSCRTRNQPISTLPNHLFHVHAATPLSKTPQKIPIIRRIRTVVRYRHAAGDRDGRAVVREPEPQIPRHGEARPAAALLPAAGVGEQHALAAGPGRRVPDEDLDPAHAGQGRRGEVLALRPVAVGQRHVLPEGLERGDVLVGCVPRIHADGGALKWVQVGFVYEQARLRPAQDDVVVVGIMIPDGDVAGQREPDLYIYLCQNLGGALESNGWAYQKIELSFLIHRAIRGYGPERGRWLTGTEPDSHDRVLLGHGAVYPQHVRLELFFDLVERALRGGFPGRVAVDLQEPAESRVEEGNTTHGLKINGLESDSFCWV